MQLAPARAHPRSAPCHAELDSLPSHVEARRTAPPQSSRIMSFLTFVRNDIAAPFCAMSAGGLKVGRCAIIVSGLSQSGVTARLRAPFRDFRSGWSVAPRYHHAVPAPQIPKHRKKLTPAGYASRAIAPKPAAWKVSSVVSGNPFPETLCDHRIGLVSVRCHRSVTCSVSGFPERLVSRTSLSSRCARSSNPETAQQGAKRLKPY